MNTRLNPLPILGANGRGEEAAETWHAALLRMSKNSDRDSTIPPDKQTLGTKYPCRFEESSAPPVWADEYDTERRKDSWVGAGIIGMIVVPAVLGLIKWWATN